MKPERVIILVILLIFMLGVISVNASSLYSTAANLPWSVQRLDDNEPDVKNLSTAFVGKNQVPMLSYTKTGSNRIYQAHLETQDVPGNCGPDDAWYCNHWQDIELIEGTVSNLATFLYGPDTFGLKWVYGTTPSATLRGATVELRNNMEFVTDSWDDLIDLGKFGGILIGAPSLQVVGGWYRVAVTIRSSGDIPIYKLVYIYKTGTSNSSCVTSGSSLYQCDVIEEAIGYNSIGEPSLQVAGDGTVGIAYYLNGAIKYAYPHTNTMIMPSNCGPGNPKTWRCITISNMTTVGQSVALAMGKNSGERGIVFSFDTTLLDGFRHAEYVGGGGNCGNDGLFGFRWQCEDILGTGLIADILDLDFSIDIDPEGYSVVAYEFDDKLSIVYPNERIENPTPGWTSQLIDGNDFSETGVIPSIAVNDNGLGLIGYMQPTYTGCGDPWCIIDTSPNLKVALQWSKSTIYLPLIVR